MRNIAFARVLAAALAALGLGFSVYWGVDAARRFADFEDWLVARPMQATIDLSQPGEVTVPLRQTCSTAHGEALFLEEPLEGAAELGLEKLLSGLSGVVTIRDADGVEIESTEINNKTAYRWSGETILAQLEPFQKGDHTATIRIDSGASRLAGQPQRIYAKYQLCGLEQMPAFVVAVFAVVSGVIGLVLASCVAPGWRRHGIWRGNGAAANGGSESAVTSNCLLLQMLVSAGLLAALGCERLDDQPSVDVRELVASFRSVKLETEAQVQQVVANAAGSPRAVMFLGVDWAMMEPQRTRFAKFALGYRQKHPKQPTLFHYVDCTPIDQGYRPLRALPGWAELERAAGGSLIHGWGEIVWMDGGRVVHVERILNFDTTEQLIAKTDELLPQD